MSIVTEMLREKWIRRKKFFTICCAYCPECFLNAADSFIRALIQKVDARLVCRGGPTERYAACFRAERDSYHSSLARNLDHSRRFGFLRVRTCPGGLHTGILQGFHWEKNVSPQYLWLNGKLSSLALL